MARVVNKEHPITKGVKDFMVTDERYYATYDKSQKNILLRAENLDGLVGYEKAIRETVLGATVTGSPRGGVAPQSLETTSISGWAHDCKGRVVFTAMGHINDAMWLPEYFQIAEERCSLALEEDVLKGLASV